MAKAKTNRQKRSARGPVSIKKLDLRNNEARAKFEQILSDVDKKFKPVTKAIRDSQRLSKEDFAVRINARR